MSTKEELQQIIADAEAELIELEEPELPEETLLEKIMDSEDYEYWQGNSEIVVDILTGKLYPKNTTLEKIELFKIVTSHSEMHSSKSLNCRVIIFWKKVPVMEKGEVTHFRKVDVVEKRYTYDWQVIDG